MEKAHKTLKPCDNDNGNRQKTWCKLCPEAVITEMTEGSGGPFSPETLCAESRLNLNESTTRKDTHHWSEYTTKWGGAGVARVSSSYVGAASPVLAK